MDNFEEALRNIDSFCKVLVKKMQGNAAGPENKTSVEPIENPPLTTSRVNETLEIDSLNSHFIPLPQIEEPLVDVFEEEDCIRILVQCRCREQQVTLYMCMDGIKICRKVCHIDADGTETCVDNCQKINLQTDHLQLENRLFVVARCNNNEVLEAMIPKIRAAVH
jgi:hypothetical protein